MLAVGTPKSDPKDLEPQKKYEAIATNFFDSFKIIPPLEADLTATWTEFSSADGKYRIQFPGAPWQFSSEINCTPAHPEKCLYRVPGTKTDMDVNVYHGSIADLKVKWPFKQE